MNTVTVLPETIITPYFGAVRLSRMFPWEHAILSTGEKINPVDGDFSAQAEKAKVLNAMEFASYTIVNEKENTSQKYIARDYCTMNDFL